MFTKYFVKLKLCKNGMLSQMAKLHIEMGLLVYHLYKL